MADVRDAAEMPRKPGRDIPGLSDASTEERHVGDKVRACKAQIFELLEEIANTGVDRTEQRTALMDDLNRCFGKERDLEEVILRELADAGEVGTLVARLREQLERVDGRLQALRELSPGGGAFALHFQTLRTEMRDHLHQVEHRLLPALTRFMLPEEADRIADAMI